MEFVLITNRFGTARRVTWNGKEYFVAPMTSIVPGVLPGSQGPLFYPLSEIKRSTKAWDGVPITNYHPMSPTGENVSVKHPGILQRQGIGIVRKSVTNEDKLKHEGWFDIERTKAIAPTIYNALENGQPLEISTGLFTDNEEAASGATYNGRPFSYIARNYRPDHIAVLPDQVGACSINDGCGLLVNASDAQGEGHWITSSGAHIFVKDGQSAEEAVKAHIQKHQDTPADSALKEKAEARLSSWLGQDKYPPAGRGKWVHKTLAGVLLKEGQSFEPAPLPEGVTRGLQFRCYDNAYKLVHEQPSKYTYVEGFAVSKDYPDGQRHAWTVDKTTGKVVDPTYGDTALAYQGVPISTKYLEKHVKDKGGPGVFLGADRKWNSVDKQLLKEGLPKGMREKLPQQTQNKYTFEMEDCPKCGHLLEGDPDSGTCNSCGYKWGKKMPLNSNPEGHNQYTGKSSSGSESSHPTHPLPDKPGSSAAYSSAEHGITLIGKKANGKYYGQNDKFDFERDTADEVRTSLKKWGMKHVGQDRSITNMAKPTTNKCECGEMVENGRFCANCGQRMTAKKPVGNELEPYDYLTKILHLKPDVAMAVVLNSPPPARPRHHTSGQFLNKGLAPGMKQTQKAAETGYDDTDIPYEEPDEEETEAALVEDDTDDGQDRTVLDKDSDEEYPTANGWVTLPNGVHVFVEGGEITKGPAALAGKGGKSGKKDTTEKKGTASDKATAAAKRDNANRSEQDTSSKRAMKATKEAASASKDAYKSSSHEEASAVHGIAAEYHQQAGDAHYEAGNKLAGEAHYAAAKEHEQLQDFHGKAHEKGKPFKKPTKNSARNPNEDSMAKREQLIEQLAVNCSCDKDRAALNQLSDAALTSLVGSSGYDFVNNAFPPPKGGKPAFGKKPAPPAAKDDDKEMEANEGNDDHSFDTRGKQSAGSAQVGGKGTKDEYPTGNKRMSFTQALEQYGSPQEKAVWNHAVQVEKSTRINLVKRLISNVHDPKRRQLIGNKLLKEKTYSDLVEMVELMPPTQNYGSQEEAPYNFMDGAEQLTGNAQGGGDPDVLEIPVMNFEDSRKAAGE